MLSLLRGSMIAFITIALLPCIAQCQAPDSISEVVLRIVEERKIPSRVSGVVSTSQLVVGLLANEGDTLLELESEKIKVRVEVLRQELEISRQQASSRVEIEFGKKSRAVAEAERRRAVESNNKFPGLVPPSEMDRLQLVIDRASAELEKNEFTSELNGKLARVKELAWELGKIELTDHVIRAPMNGMIVEVFRHTGEWVNVSEPVARMIRMDVLRAEVDISAKYSLQQIRDASPVFHPAAIELGDKSYIGKVMLVHPEINPINHTSRVWIEFPNQGLELRPGMTGRIDFSVNE